MRLADAQFIGAQTPAPSGAEPLVVTPSTTTPGGFKVGATARSFIPCTSTTRPASPTDGDAIYETDTGLEYIYTTAADWIIIGARTGTVPTKGRPRGGYAIAETTVAAAASIAIPYDNTNDYNRVSVASPYITVEDGGIWNMRVELEGRSGGLGTSPHAHIGFVINGVYHFRPINLNLVTGCAELTQYIPPGGQVIFTFGNTYTVPIIVDGNVILQWLGV